MDKYRNPETEAPDRDPRTGAPDVATAPFPGGGADEGGVKTAEGGPPSPDSPTTPGGVEGEGETERQADPALSIEAINGEGEAAPNRSGHTGDEVGEGGH